MRINKHGNYWTKGTAVCGNCNCSFSYMEDEVFHLSNTLCATSSFVVCPECDNYVHVARPYIEEWEDSSGEKNS